MPARAVRVVTETAVDRTFDYLVTDATAHTQLGDRVRVDLHGRSVRGWVVAEGDGALATKSVAKWLGYGPPASMGDLFAWAARRYYGTVTRFVQTASPARLVTALPAPPPVVVPAHVDELPLDPGVWRLPPCHDPLGLVLHAHRVTSSQSGTLLVCVPTEGWAERLAGRLGQRGVPVALAAQWDRARAGWPVVVGTRAVAFAPVPAVRGVVVLDGDDEALRSEAAPTWWAPAVLRERCAREGAPLWITAPLVSPELSDGAVVHAVADEPAGWPTVTVADRRRDDPRQGALGPPALAAARAALDGDEAVAVVVVLQRLGTGRLFICDRCGELARCPACGAAESEDVDGLRCVDEGTVRPRFCTHCGATKLRRLRSGTTTLARDVALQLSTEVTELTAASVVGTLARVVVGTEAVFRHVRRCAVVVLVDADQYLLAPRERARRDLVNVVARAGRLVGARVAGRGKVVVQSRRAEDAVFDALVSGELGGVERDEGATAELLGLPPFTARAVVSGAAAPSFVAALGSHALQVLARDEEFVLVADDVDQLTTALAATPRPDGRLRVAVT